MRHHFLQVLVCTCRHVAKPSDECTVLRGRTADGRVRVECLFHFFVFLFVVSKVISRFAAPPYHQLSPASVRRFFGLEDLSFKKTRRETAPIFIGCSDAGR